MSYWGASNSYRGAPNRNFESYRGASDRNFDSYGDAPNRGFYSYRDTSNRSFDWYRDQPYRGYETYRNAPNRDDYYTTSYTTSYGRGYDNSLDRPRVNPRGYETYWDTLNRTYGSHYEPSNRRFDSYGDDLPHRDNDIYRGGPYRNYDTTGYGRGHTGALEDEDYDRFNNLLRDGKALKVIDFNTTRVRNEKEHNTHHFQRTDCTILRRGQPFVLQISFDRKINERNDEATLILAYGKTPTLIRIPLDISGENERRDGKQSWKVRTRFSPSRESEIEVYLQSPVDAFIGYYQVSMETKQKGDNGVTRKEIDKQLILLFNPWCEDDAVYMSNDQERQEYVMEEEGIIWYGEKSDIRPRAWNFGQFQGKILEAALKLIDRSRLSDEARRSPVAITRALSAMINSSDNDNGVLVGNWTGNYTPGSTKPTEWNGSVAIIEQYMKYDRPVRYGQCWVFSGIATTIFRALGIPTRSVTNFDSAHDTDWSMTIDKYFDERGELIDEMSDSIWNYHVWNECWFKRDDLPPGFDGWQAVDATPQEASDGKMQCGPASVRAIKEGHVNLDYDTGFVFGEVQGDLMYWQGYGGSYYIYDWCQDTVGGNISTKAVGSDYREELDDNYRYKAGSYEDVKVNKMMSKYHKNKQIRYFYSNFVPEKEIRIDIQEPKNANIGEDFVVIVKVWNAAREERTVELVITIFVSDYTGVSKRRLPDWHLTQTVRGGGEIVKAVMVPYEGGYKGSDGSFHMYVNGKNKSTGKNIVKEKAFTLKGPIPKIWVPDIIHYGEETTAYVQLKNTTPITLTKCKFCIESPGVLPEVIVNRREPLPPGNEWAVTVTLNPFKYDKVKGRIMVGFESDELGDSHGYSKFFKIIK